MSNAYYVCPSVGRLVTIYKKRAGSHTSMLLSEYLFFQVLFITKLEIKCSIRVVNVIVLEN